MARTEVVCRLAADVAKQQARRMETGILPESAWAGAENTRRRVGLPG